MIKRVRAKNFLSFADLDLDFRQRNVVVGPNMSGKSNLISLLKFFSRLLSTSGLSRTILDLGGMGEIAWKGANIPEFTVGLVVEVPEKKRNSCRRFEYELTIEGSFQSSQISVRSESLTVTKSGEAKTLFEIKSGKGKWWYNGEYQPVTLQQAEQSFLWIQRLPDFEGTEFTEALINQRFYRLIPTPIMRQPNPVSSESSVLLEHGENFSSWFLTLQALPEYEAIKQVARDSLPGLSDIFVQPLPTGTVSLGSRETGFYRSIGLHNMSDGELVFIALMSLILSPADSQLYCIEEPENYLHPRMMEILIEMLDQRLTEPGGKAPQILLTTHSPALVDRISIEDLLVASRVEQKTNFERPRSNKELRNMLQRREIGLGELLYAGALADT